MENTYNIFRPANALLIVLVALIFTVSASGQKSVKPDFTGIWILDVKKSDSPVAKLLRPRLQKKERFASRLEIDHKDPIIKLTETFFAEELNSNKEVIATRAIGRISTAYDTNGKGETNQLDGQRGWGSTTVWRGDTIFVDRPDLNSPIDRTVLEFSLSKDGTQLRVTERTVQKVPGLRENEIHSKGGKSIYVRYAHAVEVDK